jgi:hypothetical protein
MVQFGVVGAKVLLRGRVNWLLFDDPTEVFLVSIVNWNGIGKGDGVIVGVIDGVGVNVGVTDGVNVGVTDISGCETCELT